MLSSPRRPSSTIRIFSSAENFRRVMRRMSFTIFSAGSFTGPDFCLIFAPLKATMSQKTSLLQPAQSVSWVLTLDTLNAVKTDRGKYVAAALTIIRAFMLTGKKQAEPINNYARYCAMIRDPLIWLG